MTINRGARMRLRPEGLVVDSTGKEAAAARLQVAYQAFCVVHEPAWTNLALSRIGNRTDASLVVTAMKAHLHRQWQHALRHPIPAAYAWRLINEHVASWIADENAVEVQAVHFNTVINKFKELARDSLRDLPEQIGLYSAILALSDRQRDVVILRYVLDLDEQVISDYLERPITTVRSNLRHAREKLARALGIREITDRQGQW
ncbi:RNA polymerase sigma factor [Streptomyces angustmyceticus]